MLELNIIYNINCLDGLKQLPDNSIDSIVTDPPYELGFLGKLWDKTGIAYSVELWKECLRVLKPGGHLLAFGGSRTYHRMACAIEDAGFEIRDQIMWIYGSGFPKSLNISKTIDKKFGAEREVIGISNKQPSGFIRHGRTDEEVFLDVDKKRTPEYIAAPATDEAKKWDGWGTALKPAHEPIILARKPLSEKTVAENILKWNTGGINIDKCRIETTDNLNGGAYAKNGKPRKQMWGEDAGNSWRRDKGLEYVQPQGRFPANIIFDEEAGKLLDEQSGIKQTTRHMSYKRSGGEFIDGIPSQPEKDWFKSETGGASRFFYCAKASKKEKGQFNNHPTVKPLSLMQYLVRLITPSNGIVLDPFAGSGSEIIACIKNNRNYIATEINNDYINNIILPRIQKDIDK